MGGSAALKGGKHKVCPNGLFRVWGVGGADGTTREQEAEEEPGEFSRSVQLPSDRIVSSYLVSERSMPRLSVETTGVGVFTWKCQCLLTLIGSFPSFLI